jgi:hypothetical protein
MWRCDHLDGRRKMKRIFRTSLAGACIAMLVASQAGAVTVANFSFEDTSFPPGGFAAGCPANWNCSGSAGGFSGGEYRPTTAQFPIGSNGLPGSAIAPDGNNAAYVFGTNPQILGQYALGAIVANTTYTLNVWGGARADQTDVWTLTPPTIEILANSVVVATLTTTDPGSGMWKNFTLSWDSLAGFTGQQLGLALVVPDTTNSQVAWDDVTLTSAADAPGATPLPGALPLFATGLGALGLLARRRKRKAAYD